MKNLQDLENTLKAELEQWFVRQCRDEYADFYLYYLPTTAEHDGGISICKNKPANPECRLAMAQRINKGATIDQNFKWIRHGVLRSLPVLSP